MNVSTPPNTNRKFCGVLSYHNQLVSSSLENRQHGVTPLAKMCRLQPASAAYWVGETGGGGYADSDNSIHPRRPSSHRLWASEIPSVKSPVISCNMAQAAQLLEKKLVTPMVFFFLGNRAALAGLVVRNN